MKQLIYYPFILILFCCKKPVKTESNSIEDDDKVVVQWRRHLLASQQESYSMSPVLGENWVIFSNKNGSDINETGRLLFLDKATGDSLDSWSEYVGRPGYTSWEEQQVTGDRLFISDVQFLNCIHIPTASSIWSSDLSFAEGDGLSYINNGYIYRSYESNGYLPNLTGTIIRSPLDREDWQQVYSYTADDDYSVSLSCITSVFLANGDELLLFKNRQWNFDLSQGRMDVFAYNLTADSLLWRNKGLEMWDGGVMPMKVEDSLVFCPGGGYFFALNLYTGEKVWEFDYAGRSPGNHFGYGDVFFNGKFLIIKPSGDELFCLTKTTGRLNWWKDKKGWTMKGRFTHFEGKLFYIADADLIVVDDYTGERLLSEERQEHLGKLTGDVRIDPTTRLMYMANYHEALCVKIPEDL